MSQDNVSLLDLPNEMLFHILKKLENVDVLYSLLGIKNQRLDIIAQEQIFSNILNLFPISQSSDEISGPIFHRFCNSILQTIHANVKSLTLDFGSMERIFDAGNYPSLTELKLYNFNETIVSRYFMGMLFMFTDH
jgi:hypothetical protein